MGSSPQIVQINQFILSRKYWIGFIGLTVAYYLAGLIGLEIQSAQPGVSPFWPASGVLLSAFIIYGIRLWPAIFISMFALSLTTGYPAWFALLPATGSILEAALPLMVARHYGFTGKLDTLREILFLLAIAWIGPTISATLGIISLNLLAIELLIPIQNIFQVWWLGNSFGILLITSSILLLFECYKNRKCSIPKNWVFVVVIITAALISFSTFQNVQNLNSALIMHLMIPLVILSSISIGFAGTLIPVSIACLTFIVLAPGYTYEAISQAPLGILYLNILELWAITLTGLLVSIAYKEGIQHKRNDWLTTHDALTGLKNRLFLDKKLEQLCGSLRHRDHNFCLLFLDLNKFKNVNDTAGHLVGDACLVHIAKSLEDSIRDTDTVARWGGDEFMVMLPDCPEQTAMTIAKKINQQLDDNPFEHNKYTFKLSFSIGIASSQSDDTPALIIERADEASYKAKMNGYDVILASTG